MVASPGRPWAPLVVISVLLSEVFSRRASSGLVVGDEEHLARALLGSDSYAAVLGDMRETEARERR